MTDKKADELLERMDRLVDVVDDVAMALRDLVDLVDAPRRLEVRRLLVRSRDVRARAAEIIKPRRRSTA